jgi:hypothetical protein
MPKSPDHIRRRIAVAALGAVLLVCAGHRTPTIGQISVTLDERMLPQVDADWSPPVARAIAGTAHVAATVATLLQR